MLRAVAIACALAHATTALLVVAPQRALSRRSDRQLRALRGGLDIAEKDEDFVEVSKMFVEAFWRDKAEGQVLKEDQRKRLKREQEVEFRRRYGSRRDPSRRRSAFYVASDAAGVPVGCAGVELDGAAGDGDIVPVMSNLAVGRDGRRKGVGAELVKACEKSARAWGCSEITLVVEDKNTPAKRLYKKLGYAEIPELFDENAKTLTPKSDGRVVSTATTTLTMTKALGGGVGGLLVPAAGVVALGVAASALDLLPF